MSMDDESRRAMIAYRQEKADIALDDADFLAESGRYSLAANRLYYAIYYGRTHHRNNVCWMVMIVCLFISFYLNLSISLCSS